MQAAGMADENYNAERGRQTQATALAPSLREAEYAGVAPALALLNTAAEVPYIGIGALNGNVRQASAGYGTSTSKTSDPMGTITGLAGAAATAYASAEPTGRTSGGGRVWQYV